MYNCISPFSFSSSGDNFLSNGEPLEYRRNIVVEGIVKMYPNCTSHHTSFAFQVVSFFPQSGKSIYCVALLSHATIHKGKHVPHRLSHYCWME